MGASGSASVPRRPRSATLPGSLLLGLVAFVRRVRRASTAPDYLEVALLMLLIPLFSPQGWDYVLLLAHTGGRCLVDCWRD